MPSGGHVGERDERYDPHNRAARLDPQRHPLALAAGETLFADFDAHFEHGLGLIIAGMAASLRQA